MMIFRIARRRWWIVASIGATTVAFAARLISGGRMTQALVADALALSAAAALVLLAARRAPEMSARARTWHHLLAAALLLGALRAALWVAGANVARANAAILVLAIAGASIWWIRRRRRAAG